MCGIVGILSFNTVKSEALRKEVAIRLFTDILQLTEERGKDATGIAALYTDGNFIGQKGNITATELLNDYEVAEDKYGGFVKVWREYKKKASVIIGHCRKSSVGNTLDNENNHPIKVGNLVGVHNGTLKNHEVIFEKLKCERKGQVDSEAIIRLFHKYTKNGKDPFTIDMIRNVVARLEGSYSVMVFNGNNPFQLATMSDQRPMKFALIRPLKLLIIASDKEFITKAIDGYNKAANFFDKGLPTILRTDVSFDELRDREVALFYLDKDIDEKTNIQDLCDTEKIPFNCKENDWLTPPTYYTGNEYFNRENANPAKTEHVCNKEPASGAVRNFPVVKPAIPYTPIATGKSGNEILLWDNKEATFSTTNKVEATCIGSIIVSAALKVKEITHINAQTKPLLMEGFSEEKLDNIVATLSEIDLHDINALTPIEQNSVVIGKVTPPSGTENKTGKFVRCEDIANYVQISPDIIKKCNGVEIANIVRNVANTDIKIIEEAKNRSETRLQSATEIIRTLKQLIKSMLKATKNTVVVEHLNEIMRNVEIPTKDAKYVAEVFKKGDFIEYPAFGQVKGLINVGKEIDGKTSDTSSALQQDGQQ